MQVNPMGRAAPMPYNTYSLRPLLDPVDEMALQVRALQAVVQLTSMAVNDLHLLNADSLSSLLGSIEQSMNHSLQRIESAIADVVAKREAHSCPSAAKE